MAVETIHQELSSSQKEFESLLNGVLRDCYLIMKALTIGVVNNGVKKNMTQLSMIF